MNNLVNLNKSFALVRVCVGIYIILYYINVIFIDFNIYINRNMIIN